MLCIPPAALPALLCSLTLSSISFWTGQGMACVGRTKECTIVPSNHYGPIPGIPVGTMWRFRVQVRVNIWSLASGTDHPEAPSPERATLQAGGMAGIKASSSCAVAQIRGEVLVIGVLHSKRKSGPWLCKQQRAGGLNFLQQPVQKVPFVLGGFHRSVSRESIAHMWRASTAEAMMERTPWSYLGDMRMMW